MSRRRVWARGCSVRSSSWSLDAVIAVIQAPGTRRGHRGSGTAQRVAAALLRRGLGAAAAEAGLPPTPTVRKDGLGEAGEPIRRMLRMPRPAGIDRGCGAGRRTRSARPTGVGHHPHTVALIRHLGRSTMATTDNIGNAGPASSDGVIRTITDRRRCRSIPTYSRPSADHITGVLGQRRGDPGEPVEDR